MKFLKENEDAVSPVIGVILMVAITVILAAVIAAFVFGMAGTVQSTKSVAATARQVGDDIEITYQGGADHNAVIAVGANINGSQAMINSPAVGQIIKKTSIAAEGSGVADRVTGGQDHVIVNCTFNDGAIQVILDTYT
jgi:flagellin-like protein